MPHPIQKSLFLFALLIQTAAATTIIQSSWNSEAAVPPSGTSFALDGISEGSVTTPTNPTDTQLFQLGNLAAGTYYLILSSSTPDTAWDYNFPQTGNYTTASGVTFLGDQWSLCRWRGASAGNSHEKSPAAIF